MVIHSFRLGGRIHLFSNQQVRQTSAYHVCESTGLLIKCVSTTMAPHLFVNSPTQGPERVGLPIQNIVDPLPDMRTCSKPSSCAIVGWMGIQEIGCEKCILERTSIAHTAPIKGRNQNKDQDFTRKLFHAALVLS